ncbi:SDR family NAD(P)-dependent oxidoreductase [Bacteroidota bacterium]
MALSSCKDFELISILRSLLSSEKLVSLRKVKKDEGNCLRIEADKLESMKELKTVLDLYRAKHGLPACITVDGIGSFRIAPTAKDLNPASKNETVASTVFSTGRMQNKVVIITGGAQGFGAGIAESFFREGANIVIADLNEEKGEELVAAFNERSTDNRSFFVNCDVSNLESVDKLVNETALHFGGVDVMISNAGILRAGGLDEMTPEIFELMTKVNYAGYFNCVKATARIMKLQSSANDTLYFDIIQINSKSGLAGSNRNFAYAGGKFGGIGLTQSFALELMHHRIKVNSICPGNFFEGPLWSDPEIGLFVQYLRAGKVKGAKTIEDVKQFYEAQVPAGRGCGTEDVAKAAFYAIEQEYETGQAIPVTGGQVMLK